MLLCAPRLTYFTLGCGAVAHPATTKTSPIIARLPNWDAFMTYYLGYFSRRVKQQFYSKGFRRMTPTCWPSASLILLVNTRSGNRYPQHPAIDRVLHFPR